MTTANPHRLVILNRAGLAPADGWIHIVPKGELPNAEAGLVQVLDDHALNSILTRIKEDATRRGTNWPGIYAGREHFIYDADKDSEALAWFKEFEKRTDGIWAKSEGLTDIGHEAVTNRRYKFTSFVADPADLQKLDGTANGLPRYRVLRIETVGFTNQANGKELLTPIINRGGDGSSPAIFAGLSSPADTTKHNHKQKNTMKSVCTLLGLATDADEPSVHAAVTKLLNRGDIAPDALATLRAEHTSLGETNQSLLNEQCETLLDNCGVKEDRVRNRLKDGMKPLKNRQERLNYLADFGYRPGEPAKSPTSVRVLNRGSSAARESVTGAHNEGEQAVALKIQNRASELQGKGLKYDLAWNQARREILGIN